MVASTASRYRFAELMNEGPDTLAEMHKACLGVVERLWLRQCETQVVTCVYSKVSNACAGAREN